MKGSIYIYNYSLSYNDRLEVELKLQVWYDDTAIVHFIYYIIIIYPTLNDTRITIIRNNALSSITTIKNCVYIT